MSEVAQRLEPLIRARTDHPGGDERALAVALAEALARRGADQVEVVDVPRQGQKGAYVLARFGRPRRIVNAHLDTVPPNAGWSRDPFAPQIVDGQEGARLVGLGAADTKGAIAAILSALDEERPRDLAVLFSGDEERSGTCLRAFLDSGAAKGIEQAIVCEPTGCRVGTRHRGVLALEARLCGEGGHSSRADELPAPIAELARLAVAWDDWGRAQRGRGPAGFLGMCLNVAALDGGIAFNVVPSEARLSISARPPPGVEVGAVRDELLAIAKRRMPAATLHVVVENPPFLTRALETFRPLLGALVEQPIDLGFWTEAAMLSSAGIDAVVIGPGEIAQAHAPDEWVAIDQLERARAIFAALFASTREAHGAG